METAIIELGTRTIQLFRASLSGNDRITVCRLGIECVALDESIAASGAIGRRAWADALSAFDRIVLLARRSRAHTLLAFAPHALGGAVNAEGFVHAIMRRFGIDVGLLSPGDSARLAYRAVRRELGTAAEALGVVHLGDASIDLAAGRGLECELAESLPLGIARMHRAYGATDQGLAPSDSSALLGLMRLSGGPGARKLREWGVPVVMASGYAGAVREVARAWGYADRDSPSVGRLSLHALVPEILAAGPAPLVELGIERWRAPLVGTAAVVIDAMAGLLGQREVWLASDGLVEGAALDVLRAQLPRLPRPPIAVSDGYVPFTVA